MFSFINDMIDGFSENPVKGTCMISYLTTFVCAIIFNIEYPANLSFLERIFFALFIAFVNLVFVGIISTIKKVVFRLIFTVTAVGYSLWVVYDIFFLAIHHDLTLMHNAIIAYFIASVITYLIALISPDNTSL
ncbi:MAG: hypothetical protein FWE24_03690 [Defluviitaleaceae bacterium]|nr:hypothetical protein [Defluviitaleaceae bacterium]